MARKEEIVAYEAAHEPSCACEACSTPTIEERLSSLEKKLDAREAAGASEYVVRDRPLVGRIVFGPSRDLEKAKTEAGRLGSVVEWVPSLVPMVEAAEPDRAHAHPPEVPVAPCAPDAAQEHVSYADRQKLPARAFALPERRGLLLTDKHGKVDAGHVKAAASRLSMMKREGHLGRGEYPEALRRIRSAGKKVGVDVSEAHECPPWYGQMEDDAAPAYGGKLRWHRKGDDYEADAGQLGAMRVKQRTPDRRNGVLPWAVIAQRQEVAQADTKMLAYDAAEKYARRPKAPPSMAAERGPGEGSGGPRCASPEDVHRLMKSRAASLGQEAFFVIWINLNDEMIGEPQLVALGQASGVHVEPEQIVSKAIVGRGEKAAVGYWAVHNHPGGTLRASPEDRKLTRRIEESNRTGAPSMTFKGHIVVTEKGWARC